MAKLKVTKSPIVTTSSGTSVTGSTVYIPPGDYPTSDFTACWVSPTEHGEGTLIYEPHRREYRWDSGTAIGGEDLPRGTLFGMDYASLLNLKSILDKHNITLEKLVQKLQEMDA